MIKYLILLTLFLTPFCTVFAETYYQIKYKKIVSMATNDLVSVRTFFPKKFKTIGEVREFLSDNRIMYPGKFSVYKIEEIKDKKGKVSLNKQLIERGEIEQKSWGRREVNIIEED